LYDTIDGEPLGKTKFMLTESRGHIWVFVITRLQLWTRSGNEKAPNGYVGLIDKKGIRIVADNFMETNEIRLDAKDEWLYVVESSARHIAHLWVMVDGLCRDREVIGSPISVLFPTALRTTLSVTFGSR